MQLLQSKNTIDKHISHQVETFSLNDVLNQIHDDIFPRQANLIPLMNP